MHCTHVRSSRPHAALIISLSSSLEVMVEKSTPGASAELPSTEEAAPFSER